MVYLYLAIAIIAEVTATSGLKATEEFSRLGPSIIVVVGYITSFYFLTLVLRTMSVGVTYAIWSGFGIVLVTLVAIPLYKQIPDVPAMIGMGLIIVGAVVINLFSKTAMH